VGGVDPDFLAVLAEALVLRGLELAAIEAGPEVAIARALALGRADENAVMLALDLRERIAAHLEQILIGVENSAVEAEFDHGLRTIKRLDLRDRVPDFLALKIEHLPHPRKIPKDQTTVSSHGKVAYAC